MWNVCSIRGKGTTTKPYRRKSGPWFLPHSIQQKLTEKGIIQKACLICGIISCGFGQVWSEK
jgi:hypothetical protein